MSETVRLSTVDRSFVFSPYWALLLGVPLSSALRVAQNLGALITLALAGGYKQVAGGRWYWIHKSGATQAEKNAFVDDTRFQ